MAFQFGNQAEYIRARLERDSHDEKLPEAVRSFRADLLAKIRTGEISASAAAIEAGFRVRTVQVQATVKGFVAAIQNHLDPTQIAEVGRLIASLDPKARKVRTEPTVEGFARSIREHLSPAEIAEFKALLTKDLIKLGLIAQNANSAATGIPS